MSGKQELAGKLSSRERLGEVNILTCLINVISLVF